MADVSGDSRRAHYDQPAAEIEVRAGTNVRLAVLFSLVASLAFCLPEGGYVGAKLCAQCHVKEFQQQSASEHAHALSRPVDHILAPAFLPKNVLTRPPRYEFRFSFTPEVFSVQIFDDRNTIKIPIDWAFGAGQQAVTFVSRISRDWYLEHHFSYYPAIGKMGVTPGQQSIEATSLAEAAGAIYRGTDASVGIVHCFQCHSSGPLDTSSDRIRPREPGVHCEACHGPGGEHARTARPQLIRNPGKLRASEINDLCGNCHRMPPPKGVQIDWNVAWNVRHEPVYLSQSACFRKSDGRLSCISCHEPHEALHRETSGYNKVCESCHAGIHKGRSEMTNCVDCHMPRVSPQPPLRFTNHWIGIYRDGAKLRPVASN